MVTVVRQTDPKRGRNENTTITDSDAEHSQSTPMMGVSSLCKGHGDWGTIRGTSAATRTPVPRKSVRWLLFLSSYTPLFAILATRHVEDQLWFSVLLFSISGLGLFAFGVYLGLARTLAPSRETVERVTSSSAEPMAYVAVYIIPFLEFDASSAGDLVALMLLLTVIGFVYVNANLIHMNPVLAVLGYQVLEIEIANSARRVLITKRASVRPSDRIAVAALGDSVFLDKSR